MKQSDSSLRSTENSKSGLFDTIREKNYDDTFPRTERWLRTANANLSTNKKERKFSDMKKYFAVNKFKLAYTFLILAFVVAACNYPVTQQEPIGEFLSWEVPAGNKDVLKQIESLDLLKTGEYTSDIKGTENGSICSYNLVAKEISPEKLAEFKKQLASIPGVKFVNSVPLNETITRPFYSAALNEVFRIDINATNKSDEDLKAEINDQFKKAGIDNATVSFERDDKGHRLVKVIRPLTESQVNDGFDLTIKDGNTVNRLKEVRKTGEDPSVKFKGKTDAEIRQMIRDDFKEAQLTDDQIQITREGDNIKVQVKVDGPKGTFDKKIELKELQK